MSWRSLLIFVRWQVLFKLSTWAVYDELLLLCNTGTTALVLYVYLQILALSRSRSYWNYKVSCEMEVFLEKFRWDFKNIYAQLCLVGPLFCKKHFFNISPVDIVCILMGRPHTTTSGQMSTLDLRTLRLIVKLDFS